MSPVSVEFAQRESSNKLTLFACYFKKADSEYLILIVWVLIAIIKYMY